MSFKFKVPKKNHRAHCMIPNPNNVMTSPALPPEKPRESSKYPNTIYGEKIEDDM